MPTAAPPQQVLYSCSSCDWTKTLDSFSVELAIGTCPQCNNVLEWAFCTPAKVGRVIEITDDIPFSPETQPDASSSDPLPPSVVESVPGAGEPAAEESDDPPLPHQRHTLRLVTLLLFLAVLVFTHMVLTSDPEKAWGVFVKLFSKETATQLQNQELREARERQKTTAEEAPEPAPEKVEVPKPTP